MRQDDFLKAQYALTAWREAPDGAYLPAMMIMNVLLNRVRQGWGSHLEVLERLPNFHAENSPRNTTKFPQIWDKHFVKILQDTDAAFDNLTKDLSAGSLYWCDSRTIERDWFKEKIIQNKQDYQKLADFGPILFFGAPTTHAIHRSAL